MVLIYFCNMRILICVFFYVYNSSAKFPSLIFSLVASLGCLFRFAVWSQSLWNQFCWCSDHREHFPKPEVMNLGALAPIPQHEVRVKAPK
jgi:hypothetical protein